MMERGFPLNVYRGPLRLMVTTTAPGLEPQNIRIELEGRRLSIQGVVRGLGQERKKTILAQVDGRALPARRGPS
jgi:HSP20 family molecular chaperone IbpA